MKGTRAPIGTRTETKDGYVYVKVGRGHPMTTDGWVAEHRLVAAEVLGRPLQGTEHVHHKTGQRNDNRPENLEVWTQHHPSGVRPDDLHCVGCCCPRRSAPVTGEVSCHAPAPKVPHTPPERVAWGVTSHEPHGDGRT